jgi:hypothetical protein
MSAAWVAFIGFLMIATVLYCTPRPRTEAPRRTRPAKPAAGVAPAVDAGPDESVGRSLDIVMRSVRSAH